MRFKYTFYTINMPKKANLFSQSKNSVRTIHHAIRENQTSPLAARVLGFADAYELSAFLGRFILDGEVLTVSQLRSLSIKRAQEILGRSYDLEMRAPIINLKNYSAAHLDYIAKTSDNVQIAAARLGFGPHALIYLLAQYTYQGHQLTFTMLKNMLESEVRDVFGADYTTTHPEQRLNLTPIMPMVYSFSSLPSGEKASMEMAEEFDALDVILPESVF